MSFDDFCLLTPFEFQAVADAYGEQAERQSRDLWECMRVLASVSVSPFSKNRVTPHSLMKFPWDDDELGSKRRKTRKPVSKEEDKARFLQRLKQIGKL